MVAYHKKKRLAVEWDLDIKPPKKYRKYANKSERQTSKRELRKQTLDEGKDWRGLGEELDEALYCHNYGPCIKCREATESPMSKTDTNLDVMAEEENEKQSN